jgi:hypothetical protein
MPAKSGTIERVCAAIAAACLVTAIAVASPRIDWDRAANIREAAEHLAKVHGKSGAAGAYKFIDACYRTHMLAERFSKPLEACIAEDYMLTQTLALIYDRLAPDERKRIRVVEPADLARAMSRRVGGALAHYKMSQQDGDTLKGLIDKHGMDLFMKLRLPAAAKP